MLVHPFKKIDFTTVRSAMTFQIISTPHIKLHQIVEVIAEAEDSLLE